MIKDNCSYVNISSILSPVQLVTYIPIFILGFLLNSFALWIFCFSMKKYTESSIYLINLAILDFFLVLSLPTKLHFSQDDIKVSSHLCGFLQSLYFTNMYGSIYTIMFISLDRYIAIMHPFWARVIRSPKKTIIICVIIWVFVWSFSLSTFFSREKKEENVNCFHNMSDSIWSPHIIIPLEIFGFFIPMTIMLYCSIQSVRTLLITVSSSVESEESKAVVVRIIICNLVVFLVCFSFTHIGIFLQFLARRQIISDCRVRKHISIFLNVALCLSNINCCLDALCYYFAVKEFRAKFKYKPNVTQVENINT
ncbi:PREDICTED: G-protein coupled receptor 55-like [Nanorana parkeri]|uniref:G-protein coupled receptor 55-like n=1 Tax=Nanorana parkeri TaxID=125878 RepID=UPI000854853F|nr:PREDICTED: G-protein coupled receptor 55-like [Nanorana parkeri]